VARKRTRFALAGNLRETKVDSGADAEEFGDPTVARH
jgi:hypothetical protein